MSLGPRWSAQVVAKGRAKEDSPHRNRESILNNFVDDRVPVTIGNERNLAMPLVEWSNVCVKD